MTELLSLDDRDWLESRLQQHVTDLSEYSFANLYLFRHAHGYRIVREPLPAVSGTTYDGVRHLLPLFDLASHAPPILARALGDHAVFYPIPAEDLEPLNGGQFEISHNEDDSDYVYETEALRRYRGSQLRKKLNQMRQFERQCEPVFEPLGPTDIAAAHTVLQRWLEESGKRIEATDYGPTHEALTHYSTLGLTGHLARTRADEPVGFLLGSYTPSSFVVRFAKGLRSYPGVFPFLFNRLALSLPESVQHLNFEQDLGNPRFQLNKRSYAPCALLRKYRIRPKH
ncbi:MAG: phosphatidylglycerol lysyltransferase domain-containing protein [Steroidobacteraceae bacterium]